MSEHLPEHAILEIGKVQLAIAEIISQLDDVEFESEEDRVIVILLLSTAYVQGWEDRFYFEHPDAPRLSDGDS